jgi:hypothetical protein
MVHLIWEATVNKTKLMPSVEVEVKLRGCVKMSTVGRLLILDFSTAFCHWTCEAVDEDTQSVKATDRNKPSLNSLSHGRGLLDRTVV